MSSVKAARLSVRWLKRLDIDDEGNIKIASSDLAAAEEAKKRIEQITSDAEVGMVYDGTVKKIMDFGAFVEILPGKDGLVHISQICEERVENVSDKLSEGDVVKVKVLEIDRQGRIRLSMKESEVAAAWLFDTKQALTSVTIW